MTDDITLDAPETRIERFLAAAAGMDGITLDEPVTRIEKYLYKIAQGSGGGSGGVLAVHDVDGTLDKTWQEIADAVASTGAVLVTRDEDGDVVRADSITYCGINIDEYLLITAYGDDFHAASPGDTPSQQDGGGGGSDTPVS